MSDAQVDDAVRALLKEHAYLQLVEVGDSEPKRLRVRCDLTQHEMLPRKEAIETYLKGKKFLKAKEWYCYDYSKYEPYIVQHRRKPKCLFCNVTNTVLNRIPAEVEKHVNGKKFQRLKEHVSFSRREGDEADDGVFDANAFEFENQQLIYSDEEDDEAQPRKKRNGSDEEGSDDEELEDDEGEDEEDSEIDEDMAEFYPKEEEESDEDEHIREAVKRLTVKKRKASTDETNDEGDEESASSPVPKTKKHKSNGGEAKAKSRAKPKRTKATKPKKTSA